VETWCARAALLQAVLKVPEFHDRIGDDERRDLPLCSGRTSTRTASG
jgi:hypothetical protein